MRALDLFCGGGLSSVGAHAAGFTTVAGVDFNQHALSAFAVNNPLARTYCARVEEIDIPALSDEIGPIDAIIASPACTDHSRAKGSRPRDLVNMETALAVLPYARRMLPPILVIENVREMRNWRGYPELLQGLRDIGYGVSEHLLDASDYGVPQTRTRVFIVCLLGRAAPLTIPALRTGRPTVLSILDPKGTWKTRPLAEKVKATRDRVEKAFEALGHDKSFLTVFYGSDGLGYLPLDRQLRTITTLGRFALVEPGPDGHTIRMLQIPELKRAMGVPETFHAGSGSKREQIRVIGNGVCAPVMEAILTHCRDLIRPALAA
jgi:DNA (cytosine-5)-methyltransferase 1